MTRIGFVISLCLTQSALVVPSCSPSYGKDLAKSFDLPHRESTKARYAISVWKTSGSRDAGGRWALILNSGQFFAQACSFITIFLSLDMELDGGDAADRIEKLGDTIVLAFAGVFELVGKIVLVSGVGLQSGNAALKILDVRPALSPRDGSIRDGGVGRFPHSRAAFHQRAGCDWKSLFSAMQPGPSPRICRTASHCNHLRSSSSLAGRGSYNDRLLVLKGQNVLNVVFAG